MNDTSWQTGTPLIPGGPTWLTLSFVVIGLGVLLALLVLAWGVRVARRRQEARNTLERRGELHHEGEPQPPVHAVAPPPVAPAPPPLAEPPLAAPEPTPLADEPIAAAAPMDASPAALAASEPTDETEADDFTRMKGVGPKVAERLNALGYTRFADLAALTPDQADALDAQLGTFQGRIHRDRWIEQARFLAAGDVAGYEAVFGKL